MDDREFGALTERVANMPKHTDLANVRAEALTAIERAVASVERALEKHERATAEAIRTEVTKTVEAAFNLQWSKVETLVATKIPEKPKRDWMPLIAVLGMGALVGFERLIPQIMRLVGS